MSDILLKFWSNIENVKNATPEDIQRDILAYINQMNHYKKLAEQQGEALEFYADESTYDIEHLSKHGYIIIDRDGGEIARKALGKE